MTTRSDPSPSEDPSRPWMRMKTTWVAEFMLPVTLGMVTLVSSGRAVAQGQPTFAPIVFWQPIVEMDERLFPSYLIATAGLSSSSCALPAGKRFGDSLGVIGVVLTQRPTGVRKVRVHVNANDILNDSDCEASLQSLDSVATDIEIFPKINYRFDALRRVTQDVPLNITFEVFADDQRIAEQTKTVSLRSINECPFLFVSHDGKRVVDLRFMFAAYVNERHPLNDSIRQEALRLRTVRYFYGYQGSTQDVYQQVFALWDVLQRRHVTYSDITNFDTAQGHVFSQDVRFVDQAFRFGQANCVDGSVLFASLLRQSGIDPVLVLIPNHMFVGFYLDARGSPHRRLAYLETTMLGTLDLTVLPEDANTFGNAFKGYASRASFLSAIGKGREESKEGLLDPQRYGQIDIAEVRALGIMPISFARAFEN